jgi:hypothetical protein
VEVCPLERHVCSTLDSRNRNRPANRDQDRYVMITFPTSQIQNPVPPHRPSIRHGGARANMPLPRQRRHRSSWLTEIPAPATDQSCAATSSANKLIGVRCPHAPPSRANLHSLGARGAIVCHFPSFIEGFRTPATLQAASLRSAGIRNPQQEPKSWSLGPY